MVRLILAGGLAFLAAVITGPTLIRFLRYLKFGQSIREEGPESHKKKAGVPTMGGVIILVSLAISTLIFGYKDESVMWALFITLGFGIIGFLDDLIIVLTKKSLGLKAREKLAGQIILAVLFMLFVKVGLKGSPDIYIPFLNYTLKLGWGIYFPLGAILLVGFSNGVNLTDGLDGLAAGTTFIASCVFMVIAILAHMPGAAIFATALAGSCIGFLWFNAHPAQVFMGDTGSLALGAALATMAILMKQEILLIIVGGIFVIETLSVMIQVTSFRLRGKRVFKMSPIHHHFELSGWEETKVVQRFWIMAIVFGLIGLLSLFIK